MGAAPCSLHCNFVSHRPVLQAWVDVIRAEIDGSDSTHLIWIGLKFMANHEMFVLLETYSLSPPEGPEVVWNQVYWANVMGW